MSKGQERVAADTSNLPGGIKRKFDHRLGDVVQLSVRNWRTRKLYFLFYVHTHTCNVNVLNTFEITN